MSPTFGYVYILTNPAMPGIVKIGHTQRRPERRLAELSGATGVPEEFQLFHYGSFENSAQIERIVHSVLDEQGCRTSKNREFFTVSPEHARTVLDNVAGSLEDSQKRETFARIFVAEAESILEGAKRTVAELEAVLVLYDHATALDDTIAPYLAGEIAYELALKRKNSPDDVRQSLKTQAVAFFETAAERGISRGYAKVAALALEEGNTTDYVFKWTQYLTALPEDEPVPADEVPFILDFMHAHMFTGALARPVVHPYLQKNCRQLIRAAQTSPHGADYTAWVKSYIQSTDMRLQVMLKWPVLVLAFVTVLWCLRPDLVVVGIVGLLLVTGVLAYARAWIVRRKEKKLAKRTKKGRKR